MRNFEKALPHQDTFWYWCTAIFQVILFDSYSNLLNFIVKDSEKWSLNLGLPSTTQLALSATHKFVYIRYDSVGKFWCNLEKKEIKQFRVYFLAVLMFSQSIMENGCHSFSIYPHAWGWVSGLLFLMLLHNFVSASLFKARIYIWLTKMCKGPR